MSTWVGHFGTLTPFLRAVERLGPPAPPLPVPPSLPTPSQPPAALHGVPLDTLGLASMPRHADGSVVDWGAPLLAAWEHDLSEQAALRLLDVFIAQRMGGYEKQRHFADGRCVSRLSPYLHCGQLSSRMMMRKLTEVCVFVWWCVFLCGSVWLCE